MLWKFIWSHILSNIPQERGRVGEGGGGCVHKSPIFGRTFGGVYKFWNLFSLMGQSKWPIANNNNNNNMNFGMHHLTTRVSI
jgi:hypothetical protein